MPMRAMRAEDAARYDDDIIISMPRIFIITFIIAERGARHFVIRHDAYCYASFFRYLSILLFSPLMIHYFRRAQARQR